MKGDNPSKKWGAVRRQLRRRTDGLGDVSAQIFFDDSIPADRLVEEARAAVNTASKRIRATGIVSFGKVHKLAKSVAVRGDPEVIAALEGLDAVKAVLPSEIDDIFPRPVKTKPL